MPTSRSKAPTRRTGRRLCGALVVVLAIAVVVARAEESSISRIRVHFPGARLLVSSELSVSLEAFATPSGTGEARRGFVLPVGYDVFRLLPHLFHLRAHGAEGRFWQVDTRAGTVHVVEDGILGFVGGDASPLEWVTVERQEEGGADTLAFSLRVGDLELTYEVGTRKLRLEGGGLLLATQEDWQVEEAGAGAFRFASPPDAKTWRLEVDTARRQVRVLGSDGEAPGTVLDLPLAYWRVDGGYGEAEPQVPGLVAPSGDEEVDNGGGDPKVWTFRWTPVPGADEYLLEVLAPSARLLGLQKRVQRPYHREVEYGQAILETNRHGWEWRVRAVRGGEELPWSATATFDVEPPGTDEHDGSVPRSRRGPTNSSDAPRLAGPKRDAVMDNGRTDLGEPLSWSFRWARISKAKEYEVAVVRDGHHPMLRARTTKNKHTFDLPGLRIFGVGRTGWTWRVRGFRDGRPGPWSEAWPFVVEPLDTDPPADATRLPADVRRRIPKLLAPKLGAELSNGKRRGGKGYAWEFRWGSVSDAVHYDVEVQLRGSASAPTRRRVEKTSLEIENRGHVPAKGCYGWTWRVRAVFEGDEAGPWSETRPFDVEKPR